MQPILNAATSKQIRDEKETAQKYCRQYDFTRRFIAVAGQSNSVEIPMPSEGDFEVLGYNIEYTQVPEESETVFLRFYQQDSSRSWSNDLIPIRSISTPGARIIGQPGVRYGFRNFTAFIRKNDKLTIDYDNTVGISDVEVFVTFTGNIYPIYN